MSKRTMSNLFLSLGVVSMLLAPMALGQQADPLNPPAQDTGPTAREDQPKLKLSRSIIDFGEIGDHAVVHDEFTITNIGKSTLVINNITASCGCTKPEIDTKVIAPGEFATVKVGFKPSGKKGPQNKRVTIRSNDPSAPQTFVQIRSNIKPIILIEPTTFQFPNMAKDGLKDGEFYVSGKGSDFRIKDISFTKIDVESYDIGEPVQIDIGGDVYMKYTIKMTVRGSQVGNTMGKCVVTTNDARQARKDFPVSVTVRSDLILTPRRVRLANLKRGSTFSQQVRINHRARKPFVISEVIDASETGVETKIVKLSDFSYRIEFKGTVADDARFVRGMLKVKTDVVGEEEVMIQFYGAIMGARAGQR